MNIPFSEIFVILLVAVLVIKPERMPEVALSLGRWVKWIRKSIANIKTQLDSASHE